MYIYLCTSHKFAWPHPLNTPTIDILFYFLCSPERSPRESLLDLDDTHTIFREKYPRAKLEMESQLVNFMSEFSETNRQFSDSNVNFARHQILEFVRELLYKSQNEALNKEVFINFSENVLHAVTNVRREGGEGERRRKKEETHILTLFSRSTMYYLYFSLLHSSIPTHSLSLSLSPSLPLSLQVRDRNGTESPELNQLVRKLLTVISRVARLVEIIEFDPNALSSSVLQLAAGNEGGGTSGSGGGGESSEWLHKLSSSHMPYILNRLNQTLESTDGGKERFKEKPCTCTCTLHV